MPYAREVAGLEEDFRAEITDLLRAYGSAYQRDNGLWEPLPDVGGGPVKAGDGIFSQDLGAGARAFHLKSIIMMLKPDAKVSTGKHMTFTAKNGSLQIVSVRGTFLSAVDWRSAHLKKNA